jgi:hypothetical protein
MPPEGENSLLKPIIFALLALSASVLQAEPRLSGGAVAVPRSVSARGGGLSSGGGLMLDSVVGENSVSTSAGAGYATAPGLMSLIAQPGSVTAIAAVTKDTGTLALSWVSPGLDGFAGNAAAGFYRIDSSSDPLHVFGPTIFTAQFASPVTAGSTRTYAVTGLLPNTTYYSRVYLSDTRKVVSETSAPSVESSLARAPAAPAFAGVFAASVTISWTIPAGGAEGFGLGASTSNFFGGAAVSSRTSSGAAATLTVAGLSAGTTYFFSLGSLNWQGQEDFAVVLTTLTPPAGLPPIQNLELSGDALDRRVTLSWTNPSFANSDGVTILVSTNPITAAPSNGTPYPPGAVFSDGAVVKSNAAASSYVQASLALNVTDYFSLFSRDASNSYSHAVSTSLALNLSPMAPAGLQGSLSSGATAFLLSWAGVASALDGTSFSKPGLPTAWELDHYDVYRATAIVSADWVWIGSAPASAVAWPAPVPVPGAVYYYQVVSRDAFPGSLPDSAMAIDTFGDLWAVGSDRITRMEIPASLAGVVSAQGNSTGRPLLMRAVNRPQDLTGAVVTSAQFSSVVSPSGQPAVLPAAGASYPIALHYATAGGYIVPGSAVADAPTTNSPQNLSAFYVSGTNAAQVYGRVDTAAQEVQVQSGLVGGYQVRTVARGAGFNFDLSGVSNRAITPNGDGLNDTVVFTFDNPMASAFRGRIYDLRGGYVGDLAPGPVAGTSLMWDAKASGRVVPSGVYIYEILAEGKTFKGTVVVIR